MMTKISNNEKTPFLERFKNISYDRSGYLQKTKDFIVLFSFILGAAAVSTIVMDLILFPVTLFSVKNSALYTKIFKYSSLSIIAGLLLYGGVLKFISYRKRGLRPGDILLYTIYNWIMSLFFLIVAIIIIALFAAVIYFLLSYNYKFLYETIN